VISGSHRGVDEGIAFLHCYPAYVGSYLSTFRESLSVPYSRLMQSKKIT
jgi:hypothetical protein